VGVLAERVEDVLDLVERPLVVQPPVGVLGPGLAVELGVLVRDRVAPPEPAVGGVEPPFLVGPRVPDLRLLAEVPDVLLAREVPQEFVDERVPAVAVELLRRQEGEALAQVHLVVARERRHRVHAGPGGLVRPVPEDAVDEFEVLSHCRVSPVRGN